MTFVMLSALLAFSAATSPADIVNAIRHGGCGGAAGVGAPLRASAGLDDVARRWSRGGRLAAALQASQSGGYRAQDAASIHIGSIGEPADIARILEQAYCSTVLREDLRDVGVYLRDGQLWLVLASPQLLPETEDAGKVAGRFLELVNEARTQPRHCGDRAVGPAGPLRLSSLLGAAALQHAQDMARNSLFDHQGSDGASAPARVSRAGYSWRTVAENIAAGVAAPEEVVAGWLASPGHCANIMSSDFEEMGVAFAVDTRSRDGIYWAQVLASPR